MNIIIHPLTLNSSGLFSQITQEVGVMEHAFLQIVLYTLTIAQAVCSLHSHVD